MSVFWLLRGEQVLSSCSAGKRKCIDEFKVGRVKSLAWVGSWARGEVKGKGDVGLEGSGGELWSCIAVSRCVAFRVLNTATWLHSAIDR